MGLEEGIQEREPFFIRQARIVSQEPLGDNFFFLTLEAPEIAFQGKAGQFVHLKVPHVFLKRPFSIFGVEGERFSIFYKVVGEGTALLASQGAGDVLEVTGPLGKPFPVVSQKKWLLVGGGYGMAPLLFLKEQVRKEEALFFYGAKTKSELKLRERIEKRAPAIFVTEDGSFGEKGLVTEALEAYLKGEKEEVAIYSCGPMGMLQAVAALAHKLKICCYVSVEARMGCGLGACLGCCLQVKRKGEVRYLRVCTEGPVFKGEEIFFDSDLSSTF